MLVRSARGRRMRWRGGHTTTVDAGMPPGTPARLARAACRPHPPWQDGLHAARQALSTCGPAADGTIMAQQYGPLSYVRDIDPLWLLVPCVLGVGQQGAARLSTVWTYSAGSVRVKPQQFPRTRASGRPVGKAEGEDAPRDCKGSKGSNTLPRRARRLRDQATVVSVVKHAYPWGP